LRDYLAGRAAAREAKRKGESPTDRAARISAKATAWMAVFTLFLALTSGGTIWILINQLREMHTGGVDTHSLANAATKTEAAAEKSAQASRDFADTAAKINSSLGTAVDKLNLQAEALNESVGQASRLAKATEEANANASAADRPWFGGLIQVSGFEMGKTPGAVCTFKNSGRRPASVQLAACGSTFAKVFPTELIFNDTSGIVSQQFVVPGADVNIAITSLFTGDMGIPTLFQNSQPTVEMMRQLDARDTTFFVYGKIEYTDVRSGEKHFSHACVQYNPTTNGTAAGFFGCGTYNEGN
jgi:hypothetical protein